MEWDWTRLAKAIRQGREAAGMTQKDLANTAEVSEGSVQNLESGMPRTRIPPSLAKIEAALGWAAGSGAEVLGGAAGPVLIQRAAKDMYIARIPDSEIEEAVTMSVLAVTDNMTAREIRELAQRITEELKRRGKL